VAWKVDFKTTEEWKDVSARQIGLALLATKKSTLEMGSRIIKRTPVDTGRTRSNWQFAVGSPILGTVKSTDRSGSRAIGGLASGINTWVPTTTGYFTNNVPWINVLENGGYPNPPKRGSFDKRTKSFVVKSQGGFSKQAPNGMVKITVNEFDMILKAVIRGL